MKWYRQTFYDHDPANYDSGMYQVGSIVGMIHGLLLGFASGGCAGGWALTAARWYERSMTAWGMTQAVYNYYEGKATWWDALAFLPAAGWGARRIGNGLGIFRACFVGDTLVLVRPMPEGTTQVVATAGAGSDDPNRWAAIGAGGFCFVVAAGIMVADARRRRKSREQQRREAIDDMFAREDALDDLDGSQDAWHEPWMDELPDTTTGDLNQLCDQLFNSDDCDWRTPSRESEASAKQPRSPVSDHGTDEPLWPDADKSWWPVSDRATDPTAGLPQLAHESVAVLDKPVDERKTETRECVMSAKPRAKAKSKARKQRGGFGLRWLAIAAITLFGALLLSLGFSSGDSPQTESRSSSSMVASPQAKYETRAIRDIRTGHRVMADNPELAGQVVDGVDIDPETWRNVVLQMTKEDGGLLDIVLLRPLEWIEAYDANVGRAIDLDLVEFGSVGPASVLSIDPCPSIEDGPGRVVTATFAHSSSEILDLSVEGVDEAIGTTPNHPFWSEDRQTFVAVGDLRIGEQLRRADGEFSRVTSISPRRHPECVYNIEVDGEHAYYVSTSGILVHNACTYQLRRALNMPSGGGFAHHIVAAGSNNKHAAAARAILKKAGISTESYWNGVMLKGSQHSGIHTNKYYKNVFDLLDNTDGSPKAAINVLDDVKARLLRGDSSLWR